MIGRILILILLFSSPAWAQDSIFISGHVTGGGSSSCISGNDANTKLLIHSNTTDGSQTFVDSAAGSTTYTVNFANAVHHETDAFKWGTTSIEFDPAAADRLYVDAYDWNFGTGDFTMEMWANFKAADVQSWMINYDSSHGWLYDGGGVIQFYDAAAPATNITASWTPVVGTWYHLAVERSGDNLIVYASGVSMCSKDLAGKAINWADPVGGTLSIGRLPAAGSNANWYLDEIAIHKGVAKHSGAASYDVPTGPYCD